MPAEQQRNAPFNAEQQITRGMQPAETAFERQKEGLLLSTVQQMEEAEDSDELKKLIAQFLEYAPDELHTQFEDDITALYREMYERHELLRVEDLKRVVAALEKNEPILLGIGKEGEANAVIPNEDGLKIAFAEGRARGPVRALVAFDTRSAIGFSPVGLEVKPVSIDGTDIRDVQLRRAVCRSVRGALTPEHIHHLVLRFPRTAFPEALLMEREKKQKAAFIFRGARLPVRE